MVNLVNELRERGMIQDVTPGLEEFLNENKTSAYVGFDPTAKSLHIGNLATIMLLKHVQRTGNKPIALVGGATGMVGDPSGKSSERNMLDKETLEENVEGIKSQLEKLLNSGEGDEVEVLNNWDWFKDFSFLDFLRDVGKNLTINYMMSKDSVKKRLETGISFTEFTYQLLQGYDYFHLHKNKNVKIQLGGSDQWGNITTGTELIRRMGGEENAFALTTPLITKSDGTKFGKSESGNVWLDPNLTSPFKFYHFFINVTDEEAPKLIRVYTLIPMDEIKKLEEAHNNSPHLRILQKELAKWVTIMVHGEKEFNKVISATNVLFSGFNINEVEKLDRETFLNVIEEIPNIKINKGMIKNGIVDFISVNSNGMILPSKTEARKMLSAGSITINGIKVDSDTKVNEIPLLMDNFLVVKKGKKNFYSIELED